MALDLSNKDLTEILKTLSEDIEAYPEKLIPLEASIVERVRGLVDGLEIDLDAPLSPADE